MRSRTETSDWELSCFLYSKTVRDSIQYHAGCLVFQVRWVIHLVRRNEVKLKVITWFIGVIRDICQFPKPPHLPQLLCPGYTVTTGPWLHFLSVLVSKLGFGTFFEVGLFFIKLPSAYEGKITHLVHYKIQDSQTASERVFGRSRSPRGHVERWWAGSDRGNWVPEEQRLVTALLSCPTTKSPSDIFFNYYYIFFRKVKRELHLR